MLSQQLIDETRLIPGLDSASKVLSEIDFNEEKHFSQLFGSLFVQPPTVPLEDKEVESTYVDKLKKVISRRVARTSKTNCLETASEVIFFLTGESVASTKQVPSIIPTEDFFKKSAHYSNEVIRDLFAQPDVPEHSVFYVEFSGNAHAFAIEKESNQTTIQYRVYQSWLNEFTLLDWLERGGKKPYTPKALEDLIKNIIEIISKEETNSGACNFFRCGKKKDESATKIIKFKFNSHHLELSYERLMRLKHPLSDSQSSTNIYPKL